MKNDARAKAMSGRPSGRCLMCASEKRSLVLDLGAQPHSDSFPTEKQLHTKDARYPLRLVSCTSCGLLQLDYLVDPSILYQQDYLYVSSTTETGRKHYTDLAHTIVERFAFPPGSLAIDIGSNVGVLLSGFKDVGMRVLGIDPAPIVTATAIMSGIDTIVDFFTSDLAETVLKRHGKASTITATNVFAHLHDVDDAVSGMKKVLAKDGVIVIEAPHALTMFEDLEYDQIYHQHVSYLSVRPMKSYFKQAGLELFEVEELSIHGGSLRYLVGWPGVHPIDSSVETILAEEESRGLYDEMQRTKFAAEVEDQRRALIDLVQECKKRGKRIIALSAPAKGNTLLNYCNLDASLIDFATERNPLKVGRYTPGTRIPIYSDDRVLSDMPDYALILAWNFADEIMKNMAEFKRRGGKFIVPVPRPRVL